MEVNSFSDIAATDNQYIMIGDTNHANSSAMYGELAGQISTMQQQGIQNLVLEFPIEVQPLLTQLARGEINANQFFQKKDELYEQLGVHYPQWESAGGELSTEEQNYRQNLTTLVQNAHKAGMDVQCVDEIPSVFRESNVPEAREFAELLVLQNTNPEAFNSRMNNATADFETKYNNYVTTLMEERETVDQTIATRISDSVGTERTAVVYGMLHFQKENDLNELLGADRSTVIMVDQDGTYLQNNQEVIQDMPEFLLDMPTREFSTPPTNPVTQSFHGLVNPEEFKFSFAVEHLQEDASLTASATRNISAPAVGSVMSV